MKGLSCSHLGKAACHVEYPKPPSTAGMLVSALSSGNNLMDSPRTTS